MTNILEGKLQSNQDTPHMGINASTSVSTWHRLYTDWNIPGSRIRGDTNPASEAHKLVYS